MTLKAFCAGVGLLGLLTSNALASMPGDGAADANDADTCLNRFRDATRHDHGLAQAPIRAGAKRDHPRDCGPLHTAPEITAASMDF